MSKTFLDHGVTQGSVCNAVHLHCFQNSDRFSKLAFGLGQYKDLDMSNLDLTEAEDFATYMALRSSGQGKGIEELDKKYNITGDGSLRNLCTTRQER